MALFTELTVYKVARSLRKKISELVKKQFPIEEKYRLSDQILRSSRGVTNCISEGYGRYNYQDISRFCRMSRGSLMETLDHLIIAYDEKIITEEQLKEYKADIDICLKLLNGYINYLQRQKNGGSVE